MAEAWRAKTWPPAESPRWQDRNLGKDSGLQPPGAQTPLGVLRALGGRSCWPQILCLMDKPYRRESAVSPLADKWKLKFSPSRSTLVFSELPQVRSEDPRQQRQQQKQREGTPSAARSCRAPSDQGSPHTEAQPTSQTEGWVGC